MSRALLIAGATGKQGGAVIDALLSRKQRSSDFLLLAVTRNAQSASAKRLAAKSSSIRLVEGDFDATPALFEQAKKAAGAVPLWGVFGVQGVAGEKEETQGKALIDEAIKAGVQHFVYSSVERGGDDKSWTNPTPVPHFRTKHQIELHLRDAATTTTTTTTSEGKPGSAAMGWTILRPVMFMDNFEPGFFGKVFFTALRDTVGPETKLQLIATKDIGFFAAESFLDPRRWDRKAFGLASTELTFSELAREFERVTGRPVPTTFGFLGKTVKAAVAEVGLMLTWFRDEGFGADVEQFRKCHPDHTSLEAYLKNSAFSRES